MTESLMTEEEQAEVRELMSDLHRSAYGHSFSVVITAVLNVLGPVVRDSGEDADAEICECLKQGLAAAEGLGGLTIDRPLRRSRSHTRRARAYRASNYDGGAQPQTD
jgi:hypothetical protein